MTPRRVLFLFTQARLRSPTAERIFSERPDLDVACAGLGADADRPLTTDRLDWAEMIFVMERAHLNKLRKRFKAHLGHARIVCLNIPDDYEFMDPHLVSLLKLRVGPYLPKRDA